MAGPGRESHLGRGVGRWLAPRGAAEPDPAGLDHAWFVGDAAKAVKDVPRHALWAVTFKPTGGHFPLAWDDSAEINAENVTDRYKSGAGSAAVPEQPRLMVEVERGGHRVEAEVSALDRATEPPLSSGARASARRPT